MNLKSFLIKASVYGVAVAAMSVSGGCRGSRSNDNDREAEQLFRESYSHIKAYTDSINRANDTLSVRRLSENFEKGLERINFSHSADADLGMTEQENDSLAALMNRYAEIRDSRLEKLHLAKIAVENGSESDSIGGKK